MLCALTILRERWWARVILPLAFTHERPHMTPSNQLRKREFRQPMGATLSSVFARESACLNYLKGKMEISLSTMFHDVSGDENLFMLADFNEQILDLVEVRQISP